MFEYRDPDKPDKSTTKNVVVASSPDLTVSFVDTDISRSDIAGPCLATLSNGDFLITNGIDRDSTGVGDQRDQSWFVQPGNNYVFERADKTM